jgi:hypothetical protein
MLVFVSYSIRAEIGDPYRLSPYERLGIGSVITSEVEKSYQRTFAIYGSDPIAAENLKEARETLLDPHKREALPNAYSHLPEDRRIGSEVLVKLDTMNHQEKLPATAISSIIDYLEQKIDPLLEGFSTMAGSTAFAQRLKEFVQLNGSVIRRNWQLHERIEVIQKRVLLRSIPLIKSEAEYEMFLSLFPNKLQDPTVLEIHRRFIRSEDKFLPIKVKCRAFLSFLYLIP